MKKVARTLALIVLAAAVCGCMGVRHPVRSAPAARPPAVGTDSRPRSWAGVVATRVTAGLAEQLGFARPEGVVVTQVAIGSPAQLAGIAPGDVVTHLQGRPLADFAEMQEAVRTLEPGRKLRVGLVRNGRAVTIPTRGKVSNIFTDCESQPG